MFFTCFLHVFTNFYFSVLSETRLYHINMAPANSRSQPRWVGDLGWKSQYRPLCLDWRNEYPIRYQCCFLMFLFLCGSKLSEDGILASTNMADVVNLGLLPWGPSPKRKNCLGGYEISKVGVLKQKPGLHTVHVKNGKYATVHNTLANGRETRSEKKQGLAISQAINHMAQKRTLKTRHWARLW